MRAYSVFVQSSKNTRSFWFWNEKSIFLIILLYINSIYIETSSLTSSNCWSPFWTSAFKTNSNINIYVVLPHYQFECNIQSLIYLRILKRLCELWNLIAIGMNFFVYILGVDQYRSATIQILYLHHFQWFIPYWTVIHRNSLRLFPFHHHQPQQQQQQQQQQQRRNTLNDPSTI